MFDVRIHIIQLKEFSSLVYTKGVKSSFWIIIESSKHENDKSKGADPALSLRRLWKASFQQTRF